MGKVNPPINTPLQHHSHNEVTYYDNSADNHGKCITLHIAGLETSRDARNPPKQPRHAIDRTVDDDLVKEILEKNSEPQKAAYENCAIDLVHIILVVDN